MLDVVWVADRELRLTPAQVTRFLSKFDPGPADDCWPWAGGRDRDDYGVFTLKRDGRTSLIGAHRVAYMLEHGRVPDGLQVDHTCRVRYCVNVAHLEAVTSRENTMRSPIAPAAVLSRMVICSGGHVIDADVYVDANGHRHCRPCHAAASARWRAGFAVAA